MKYLRCASCGSLSLIMLMMVLPASADAAVRKPLPSVCRTALTQLLRDEVAVYRRVQYGSDYPSVLMTKEAATTDLVPYLLLNHHALHCRLQSLCEAVRIAVMPDSSGPPPIAKPVGCSRMFPLRGRWWDTEERDWGYLEDGLKECEYALLNNDQYMPPSLTEYDPVLTFSATNVAMECRDEATMILEEEQAMLQLLSAHDGASRGVRTLAGVFQMALADIREGFLVPLRGIVDLVGSVLYPIPCLLTQCN